MVFNTFSYFEVFLYLLVLIRLQRWGGRECFAPHSHGSERAPTFSYGLKGLQKQKSNRRKGFNMARRAGNSGIAQARRVVLLAAEG